MIEHNKFFYSSINEDEYSLMIANLMVFYKGAVSYKDLQSMPVVEVYQLQKNAISILDEIKKENQRAKKQVR